MPSPSKNTIVKLQVNRVVAPIIKIFRGCTPETPFPSPCPSPHWGED